mgnify:CR=1 FL=1|jgi:hypothetical protein
MTNSLIAMSLLLLIGAGVVWYDYRHRDGHHQSKGKK